MLEISIPELMVLCSSGLLTVLLLTEVLDWAQLFPSSENNNKLFKFEFGYRQHNGPRTWKKYFPKSNGHNQSPINIETRLVSTIIESKPLRWIGYRNGPSCMFLSNNGLVVSLHSDWSNSSRPYICGGPLCYTYNFNSMTFHWGPSDVEGSEHTIDLNRFPMELQLIHLKTNYKTLKEAIASDDPDGIVIISFFFEITKADNPYLDYIVTNLWRIIRPHTSINVPQFPLGWLFPTFEKNYYTYNGSLTQPPCNEIVTWIVYPNPIAISSSQMTQFRTICSVDGPVLSNCRPVQLINCRDIHFNE